MSDRTEFIVILDRSGSMQAARADHEGGLNSFVEDQKSLAGDVRFTLVQFDSTNPCEIIYDGVPVREVGKCELIPRGGTPLLDAIGKAVAHVRPRIEARDPKPDQIVVLVITDGEENSSVEWTKARVKDLIAEREAAGWKFLYLGANVDAFSEAGSLGVAVAMAAPYANTTRGVTAMYAATTSNTRRMREAAATGVTGQAAYDNLAWTDAQRKGMTEEAPPSTTGTTTTSGA